MASSGFGLRAGHLDATEQEVVFCHVCSFEWPRVEHESISCPRCNSEATEVIEPDNDPRVPEIPDIPFPPSLRERLARNHRRHHDSDSDPEEGDIEEHVATGPGNTFMRRTVFGSPPARSPDGRDRDPDRLGTGGRDDVMLRFADMLYSMGAGQHPASPGGPGREPNFPPRPERTTDEFAFGGPRIQRTTFRSGPHGGSVTITSSTIGGGPGLIGGPPDFNRLFGDLLGGPRSASPGERPARPPMGPPLGIAAILQELIGAAVNPSSAVHGDAVYTQEALDRIVSTLMEAHPQSNAAPPASQTAIEQLEKKKLTDEMVGPEGKAECTICIDEMHRGDDVTVLPCTHWFHGDCVTLWLKEHNTCPICRRPIETREERRERRATGSSLNADQRSPGEQSRSAAGPSSSESPLGDRNSPGSHPRERYPWDNILGGSSRTRMDYFASSRPQDSDQQMGQDRNSPPLSRGFFYMSTNGGGPNSTSPSSSRPEMPGQYPSSGDQRDRDQASNSSSNRRTPLSMFGGDSGSRRDDSSQSRESGRRNSEGQGSGSASGSSSHNPFNWFRNHLGGGRNSGNGSGGSGAGSSSDNKDRERRWRS